MAKKRIIKGVGSFMAQRISPTGKKEMLTLGTLQNLRIDFNTEKDDIFGGDGLFPIDDLITNRTIEITATDAQFDLHMLELMTGASIIEDVEDTLWVLGEKLTVDAGGIATLKYATTLATEPEVSVRLADNNVLLDEIDYDEASTPTADEFMVSPDGDIKVATSLIGKTIVVNYKREAQVTVADVLIDQIPVPVYVVHHGSFLQKDGTYAGIETEIFACKANGTFSIDTSRASASAPQVTLSVIDPGRPDGKMARVKVFESTTRE